MDDLRPREQSGRRVGRIEAAIGTAEEIFDEVAGFAAPGKTESEVAQFMLAAARHRGIEMAWAPPCPIVNTGPHSMIGHGLPSDQPIEPGHVLHIDFGVRQDGYCSDLQRCWYVPGGGRARASRGRPPGVRRSCERHYRRGSGAQAGRRGLGSRRCRAPCHHRGRLSRIRTRTRSPRRPQRPRWWRPFGPEMGAIRKNAVPQNRAGQRVYPGAKYRGRRRLRMSGNRGNGSRHRAEFNSFTRRRPVAAGICGPRTRPVRRSRIRPSRCATFRSPRL